MWQAGTVSVNPSKIRPGILEYHPLAEPIIVADHRFIGQFLEGDGGWRGDLLGIRDLNAWLLSLNARNTACF